MITIFLFLLGILILARGASWFSDSSLRISLLLGVPQAFVGVTIVSLVTTAPETVIALVSQFENHPQLALGNILGSPIVNMGLIFALLLLFSPLELNKKNIKYGLILFFTTVLLYVFAIFRGQIDFWFSIPLLLMAFLFLYFEFRAERADLKDYFEKIFLAESLKGLFRQLFSFFKALFKLLFSFVLILIGGMMLVNNGSDLAKILGVSEIFIGLTLLAISTSLPELSISIAAILKRRTKLSQSNLFGASILTLTWALGVAAMVRPIILPKSVLFLDLPVLLILSLVFVLGTWFGVSKRAVGIFSLVLYGGFIFLLKITG